MSADTTGLQLGDNPARLRFEARLGDELAGYSNYVLKPGRVVFTHTEVDPAFEGRGIGSQLVRYELDEVRARGLKVTPKCPFVRSYIRRHAEYRDLLAEPEAGQQGNRG